MTKHISLGTWMDISYPVGLNLQVAQAYIQTAVNSIKNEIGTKPISLWVRGSSGAILATLFAVEIKNHVIINHIKKEGESAHLSGLDKYNQRHVNIILDDFIETGSTIREIYKTIGLIRKNPRIDFLIVAGVTKNIPNLEYFGFEPKCLVCDATVLNKSLIKLTK